jgi:hypothetical protein
MKKKWGVVQLVGHLTVNEDGEGSNPSAPAKFAVLDLKKILHIQKSRQGLGFLLRMRSVRGGAGGKSRRGPFSGQDRIERRTGSAENSQRNNVALTPLSGKARVAPTLPAAIHRFHVGITHFLEALRHQRRAKSATAV